MVITLIRHWLEKKSQVLACLLIAVVLAVLCMQTMQRADRTDGNDFTSYLLSAKALWQGEHPYRTDTPYTYIYPLFLAFMLVPLIALPYGAAVFVWFGLSIVCLGATCRILLSWMGEEVGVSDAKNRLAAFVVLMGVMLSPLQCNLLNGQVNLIVLFCCTMFLNEYLEGKKTLSAAWLAAAIALKIVPAILLVFLLVRRQWRMLFVTVFFVAAFCLLPMLLIGRVLVDYYVDYWNYFVWPSALGHVPKNGMFFGLRGTIEYLMPASGSWTLVRVVAQSLTLLAILGIDMTHIPRKRSVGCEVWPFCAYLLGCLLLSPTAEVHHLVFAIPAVLLVGFKTYYDRAWRSSSIVAMTLVFLFCFDVAAPQYRSGPFFFVSLVILLILLFLAKQRITKSELSPIFEQADAELEG